MDKRIKNEIEHDKFVIARGPEKIWSWGTPAGSFRFQRRVQMLKSHITPDMRVLEVGCGCGFFTKEIAKTNSDVIAIDISNDMLGIAKRRVIEKNVRFKIENAYDLSFEENTFNTIVGSSVLHHLEVKEAISGFSRVLKPGGTVYFTEPNMVNPQIFLQKNITIIKKLSGDSPDETAFFRWCLKNKLKQYGFQNIRIIPFDFLHPQTPKSLIPLVKKTGAFFERIPIIKEISGSLYITAEK